MNPNLEAARQLVSAGVFVFPAHPETKNPLVHSIGVATNVPRGVDNYWATRPHAVPGVPAGKNGPLIADLDVGHKQGVDGIEAFSALADQYGFPECPAIRTPRGGVHLYMRQPLGRAPLGNVTGILPAGVDIRGAELAYVIGPGAVLADGTFYEAIEGAPDLYEAFATGSLPEPPQWLIEMIEADNGVVDRGPPSTEPLEDHRARAWIDVALEDWVNQVAQTGEGGRNNKLNKAVYTLAGKAAATNGALTEAEVWDAMTWACEQNGYLQSTDPSDGPKSFEKTFRSSWRSGFRKPMPGPRERYPVSNELIVLKA